MHPSRSSRPCLWLLLPVLTLFSVGVPAQKLIPPPMTEQGETPPWVNEMLSPDPDVFALDETVRAWMNRQAQGKTTWIQYYKKWRRAVDPWLTPEGRIRPPDKDQLLELRTHFASKKATTPRNNSADWICLGPFETINDAVDGNQIPVSWQANVYCLDQSLTQPDILYCGTEGAEIFRTQDRGITWQPASLSLACEAITALAIHPTNPQVVYAGDRHHIYRTENGGISWEVLLTESQLSVNAIAIHPLQPEIILVAGGKGLWRTANGGSSWSQLFPEACYDLAFRPGTPEVVYLLKDDPTDKRCTFWKSTNTGQSFAIRSNGWFDGQDPTRSNGGARMTVTPADPDRIYTVLIGQAKAGDNGFIGVYRSDNSGEIWTLPNPPAGGPYTQAHPNLAVINPFQGTGFHQGFYNLGIAASHTNPEELLVGHLSLWRSTNGAAAFQLMGGYGGILNWIHPDVQMIHVKSNDTWVCTDGGINYSQDFFSSHTSRKQGITGSDFWGFSQGWNDDILAGGRYHNGNTGWFESYPQGLHLRLGGAEAPTGYVRPGPGRHAYFSDIGGKILPAQIQEPSRSFPVSRWPNELYFPGESSEQVWAPDCYNHYYLGQENALWKTEDGGNAFRLVKAFDQLGGGRVTQIALCREHPQVLYVAQRNSASWSEGWVWKTTDGGDTWTSLPLPIGYKRRFQLSVSATEPNLVWLGYTDGANGEKVFESPNGGFSWTNITSPLLNGESVQSLAHLAGTPGSLMLGTNRSVYYRPGPNGEWQSFNEGLPTAISVNILRPFYRDSKLRLGAWGKGIWESPLPEAFEPVIQPTVDKLLAWCPRDTFHFDDHSVLNHEGVSWSWTFPDGSPPTSEQRDPRVVFSAAGIYEATLTLQGPLGILSRSLTVEVRDECAPDSLPGLALRLQDNGDAAVVAEGDGSLHPELTFAAWVKPDGMQASYAGIVIGTYDGNAYGLNVRDDNRLGYHWPGGAWWWDSGLTLLPGEWQHVALVIRPGSATIFLNGVGRTHNTSVQPVALDALHIGRYRDWNERTFKGWMDEVCIYDRALTQAEIREGMHLTREQARDTGLLAYYQFNRTSGAETDRVGSRHLAFAGGAHRVVSTVPAGAGISTRRGIALGEEVDFGEPGVTLSLPAAGAAPDGEWVLSRIRVSPDRQPDEDHPASLYWWVMHHFGQNTPATFASLRFEEPLPLWPENVDNPTTLNLYHRGWNGEGPSWMDIATAEEVEIGPPALVHFLQTPATGQWILVNSADPVTSTAHPKPERYPEREALLAPNPVATGQAVRLMTDLPGPLHWRLLDAAGRLQRQGPVQPGEQLDMRGLLAGWYFYEIRSEQKMIRGALLIQ